MALPGLGTLPESVFLALLRFIQDHQGLQPISESMLYSNVYLENPALGASLINKPTRGTGLWMSRGTFIQELPQGSGKSLRDL